MIYGAVIPTELINLCYFCAMSSLGLGAFLGVWRMGQMIASTHQRIKK